MTTTDGSERNLSLYGLLSLEEPADRAMAEHGRAKVSTRDTLAVETIDNDRVAAAFGVLLPG